MTSNPQDFLKIVTRFLRTDIGTSLLIAVAWQAIFTVFGYIVDSSLSMFHNSAAGPGVSLLNHTSHWDGGWYTSVVQNGYGLNASPAEPAFYPLFPLLVTVLQFLSLHLLGIYTAGLIINTIALAFGVTALIKIVRHFTENKQVLWMAVSLFLLSPVAFFMHMFYGEAVFIAFGFWAYYFALKKRWGSMAITLAIVTSARLPALLFVALCGLEFLRSYDWSIKRILNKNLLWFLLAPIGLVGYSLYLYIKRGDFLAMIHAYHATKDWAYYTSDPNIVHTLLAAAKVTTLDILHKQMNYLDIVNGALPLIGLLILFIVSLYALIRMRGKGIPLGIFGLLAIIMFTINGTVVSAHRYLLPCISLFLIIPLVLVQSRWSKILFAFILLSCALLEAYLMILFISGYFAG